MQCCRETRLLLTLVPTEQIRKSPVAVTLPAVAAVPPCLRDLFYCTYCERICNPNFAPPFPELRRRFPCAKKTERRLMRQQPEDTEVGVITTPARGRVFRNTLGVDQCHFVSNSFKCCYLNVFCTVSRFYFIFFERCTNNMTNNSQQQRDRYSSRVHALSLVASP